MAKHHFHLQANWPGGRNEVGTIESGQLKTQISIPPEMDGPGVGTNPDEMLLGAAATCYIITLAAMLERSGIYQEALTMESEAVVDVTNGVFTYEKIIHKPHVIITPELTDQEEKISRLIKKAETSCMISRAIQGNVEIELEPRLTVKA
ncbi:OsmC family protein [Priestia megaterium]|uniref:OsmC family protein n=1 Tax=Priestia megaterium TaxID=1404 RepID=UPI002E2152B2|nr:OsmC family protein [Priestia megaterium]